MSRFAAAAAAAAAVHFYLSRHASLIIIIHTGISFKTQALYVTVFITRYLDLFYHWVSLYNTLMKVVFVASSCYILYLMKYRFRSVHSLRLTAAH
jgi:ER lumen protein retaining receptor